MAMKCPTILIIRLLACIFTSIAAGIMGKTHETVKYNTYFYEAHYFYWGAFKFFVITYTIASIYNFVVLFIPAGNLLWRLVVLFDWIITTAMITSCGMVTNSYIEMKNGVAVAGWSPQCGVVPAFCTKVLTALVFGYIGLLICVPVFFYTTVSLANAFLLGLTLE